MSVFWLTFFISVVVLLLSADAFVKIASKIWLALRISPLIIGTTIVAVGTSLAELGVSLIASFKNDRGLAVGNIVGSNIANVFLVLGIGVLLGNINIGISKTQRSAIFLLLATGIYVLTNTIFSSAVVSGLVMISLAVVFSWLEVYWGILGRNHEDKKYVNGKKKKFNSLMLGTLLLSVSGIVVGGIGIVYSVEKISLLTGYSTTTLGLSITAMATSLPELSTTVFSRKKDQGKIAIGNILGSNIYNLLLIGGIVNLFFPVRGAVLSRDLYILAFATFCLAFLVFFYAGRKVPKKIGLVLLIFFFLYLFSLK